MNEEPMEATSVPQSPCASPLMYGARGATLALNADRIGSANYPSELEDALPRRTFAEACAEIRGWPSYEATALRNLSSAAAGAGIASLLYKDESTRFGLGSFKALGGAYAVMQVLATQLSRSLGRGKLGYAELTSEQAKPLAKAVTVACATDGNHGRSVAWGARMFGCSAVIYLHAGVSQGRERALEDLGARVIRIDGNYDDSVRAAAAEAAHHGWIVVSDTSYGGYLDIPRQVMAGYGVMVAEILGQLAGQPRLTHVFVQAGVGGLAAAVCAYLWQSLGPERPMLVVVEPEKAACLQASARTGRPVVVEGELDTVMAGLACGEVSEIAWQILSVGADAFMTIDDAAALEQMRQLAATGIVAGESATAGVAASLIAAEDPAFRSALRLDGDSRVLCLGTEGATDPDLYEAIIASPTQ